MARRLWQAAGILLVAMVVISVLITMPAYSVDLPPEALPPGE